MTEYKIGDYVQTFVNDSGRPQLNGHGIVLECTESKVLVSGASYVVGREFEGTMLKLLVRGDPANIKRAKRLLKGYIDASGTKERNAG